MKSHFAVVQNSETHTQTKSSVHPTNNTPDLPGIRGEGKDMYFRRSTDAISYAKKHYEDWSIWFDDKMKMFYIIGKMKG